MKNLIELARRTYESWGRLAAFLSGEARPGAARYHSLAADPQAARTLTEAGFTGSQGTARRLVRRFDFAPYRHLLDLGGGSAVYAIEACKHNPRLQATVLDFPVICAVAREFIAAAGLSERIETMAGDFTTDPWPAGADCILLCGNIHAYTAETARQVVGKAYEALPAGGGMIICDYMLDDDKTGPPVAAFMSLAQVFNAGGGKVHTGADFAAYLSAAGFRVTRVEPFSATHYWAQAWKSSCSHS